MATLDPRFISTSDLETYYVDKDSGQPLSSGIITFYSNTDQTTPKDVYILDNLTNEFVSIGNVVTLSVVGTPQYLGNPIIIYYFPYEGSPNTASNVIELYYITIQNSGNVLQKTLYDWPPNVNSGGSQGVEGNTNYIPNGQFLSHNDKPITEEINGNNEVVIAQGGWRLKTVIGSTYSFINSNFQLITTPIGGLNDYPRYAYNFICSVFGVSSQIRDLSIQWPNVFKFIGGNPPGSQDYTFSFAGQSTDGNTYTFDIRLIYNYGSGSPTANSDVSVGTVQITPTMSYFNITLIGNNYPVPSGTLGANNDDYIEIALRGPANSTWNILVTDFSFLLGQVTPNYFPVQTDDEMLSRGVTGWMPTPDPTGKDLYLPLILTQNGMIFDDSNVGHFFASSTDTISPNELLCDGSTYKTSGYSSVGIPYSRLQSKWFNTNSGAPNLPSYGTGSLFVSSYPDLTNPNNIWLSTNVQGSATVPNDSSVPVGITITKINTGLLNINLYSYPFNDGFGSLFALGNTPGLVTNPNPGTSGFSVNPKRNDTFLYQLFHITPIAPSSVVAGSYWQFYSAPGNVLYYMWFKVNNSGSDPAPGGIGIEVDILSTWNVFQFSQVICSALNGFQNYTITFPAASSITGGSYWQFYTTIPQGYYVWYKVAGVGSDPMVSNQIGIEVVLSGTETSAQVSTATQIAMNSTYFAVPDLRGFFLRGKLGSSPNPQFDPNYMNRWGINIPESGNFIGTFQQDSFLEHNHIVTGTIPGAIQNYAASGGSSTYNTTGGTSTTAITAVTLVNGEQQVAPLNSYVNWVVKY